jgi:pre-mRNA-processing factor 40
MPYGYNPGRDSIAQELMAQNNPAPGYLSPPQMPPPPSGLGPPPPPAGMASDAQTPFTANSGAGIAPPQQAGLPLPGVMTPGQLPRGMAPQVGGMPQMSQGMPPAPPQPSMPMPGAVAPPRY